MRYWPHVSRRKLRHYGRNLSRTAAESGIKLADLRRTIEAVTHFIREPRKLPVVLSPDEVARLLAAAPGLKYKAALSVAYGAGLRANEVISLKVGDIDSKRMIIRVEQGKALGARGTPLIGPASETLHKRGPAGRHGRLAQCRSAGSKNQTGFTLGSFSPRASLLRERAISFMFR
jgi:integrase